MEPDPTFWPTLIRDLRNEKGWSQRELAERANVNRTTLRSIEDGARPAKRDILEKLLAVLEHDLRALPIGSYLDRLRSHAATETDPDRRSKLAARILLHMTPD